MMSQTLDQLDAEAQTIAIELDAAWAADDEDAADEALAALFWINAERMPLHRKRTSLLTAEHG